MRCRLIFTLMAAVFLTPAVVEAQTGRVVLQATVSETVTLSVAPTFTQSNVNMAGNNTVRITLSSDDPVIRIPLLVRSNSSFKISAVFESTAELSQLSVVDVQATGNLVSPQAVNGFNIPQQFDPAPAGPFLLASGPRVSLGGTLNSADNALQITLLIRLNSQSGRGSLTLVATAGPPIQ